MRVCWSWWLWMFIIYGWTIYEEAQLMVNIRWWNSRFYQDLRNYKKLLSFATSWSACVFVCQLPAWYFCSEVHQGDCTSSCCLTCPHTLKICNKRSSLSVFVSQSLMERNNGIKPLVSQVSCLTTHRAVLKLGWICWAHLCVSHFIIFYSLVGYSFSDLFGVSLIRQMVRFLPVWEFVRCCQLS